MKEFIGINIGALLTKFSAIEPLKEKEIYNEKDFKLKLVLNDIIDRVLPSIIQYKENNTIFIGQSTKLGYKKYYLSTFDNLSRLLGLVSNNGINELEKKYFLTLENFEIGYFNFIIDNIKYQQPADYFVFSFIEQLDKKIKNKLNDYELKKYIFAIPDYYTYYQKESLQNMLKLKYNSMTFPLINESTALTMYYGYFNYKELNDDDKKYIIFIDIGHSKTSFILSEFTKKEFIVKNVVNIPFLGGRDFNNRIFEFCLKKFKEEYNRDLTVTGRIKVRLMEEIEIKRKILSINDEVNINIDGIEKGIDFSFIMEKSEFEEIISNEIELFKREFKLFYDKIKTKYKISKIEMAGQLMRTPKLKSIVYEISEITLSETIAMDMCHSFGVLLYGTLILEKRNYEELKSVKSYNNYSLYYSFDKKDKEVLIKKGDKFPFENRIIINDEYKQNCENIFIYYDNNELNNLNIVLDKELQLINIKNCIKKNEQYLYLNYKINEENEITIIDEK